MTTYSRYVLNKVLPVLNELEIQILTCSYQEQRNFRSLGESQAGTDVYLRAEENCAALNDAIDSINAAIRNVKTVLGVNV